MAGGAQRFAARALAARRRPWRRLTFGAIVLTIVAVVSWLVLGSPLLAVGRILVVGANTSVEAGVQKAASSSLGTSMLRVDLAGLEATIEKDSRISDATVNRRFPRSLVVTVVPRVAVLVITDSKGQLELVDADGVAFRSVDKAPKGLAVVRKAASGELTKEGVAAALQVVTALPKALRERVKDVRLTESDSVTFRIGTVAVVWGDAEQPERKARLIEILLREKPKVIDVSAPETPVTT